MFLKWINVPLTNFAFLIWLLFYKFSTKDDGGWYQKYSLNICLFIFFYSCLISFINSSRNFNADFLSLVFAFVSSGSNSGAGASSSSGSDFGSGVDVGTLSYTENILLWKLLRIIKNSLARRNNPKLFRKNFFSTDFWPLYNFFNSSANLLCSLSASPNVEYPSGISLKTVG